MARVHFPFFFFRRHLGTFVSVDLNLWPTVYIAVADKDVKWIKPNRQISNPYISETVHPVSQRYQKLEQTPANVVKLDGFWLSEAGRPSWFRPFSTVADRKWCSRAVPDVTGVHILMDCVCPRLAIKVVEHTEDRSERPLPVCCRHSEERLELTSRTSNSRNSSKNYVPSNFAIYNRSETTLPIMSHALLRQIVENDWTDSHPTHLCYITADRVNVCLEIGWQVYSTDSCIMGLLQSIPEWILRASSKSEVVCGVVYRVYDVVSRWIIQSNISQFAWLYSSTSEVAAHCSFSRESFIFRLLQTASDMYNVDQSNKTGEG